MTPPTRACCLTRTSPSSRPTSSATRRRASSRPRTRWRTGRWSRCSGGTTTNGASRTGSSISARSLASAELGIPRLEDLPLERGRRVLVRVDLKVPLEDGAVADDLRITTALPTLGWLREHDAAVIVAGHLGRPKGTPDPQYSMAPVAARLSDLLGQEVPLAPGVAGAAPQPPPPPPPPGDAPTLGQPLCRGGGAEGEHPAPLRPSPLAAHVLVHAEAVP